VQLEGPRGAGEGDVGRGRGLAVQQRGDVRGPGLQGVRLLGVVVLQQEVADAVVEGVVDAALALEGVALCQRAWRL